MATVDPLTYKDTILSQILGQPVADPTKYSAAYGGIPTLPAYTQDVTTTVGEDPLSQIRAQAPLYDPTAAQSWQNIYDWSQGLVGRDVVANLGTAAAERGRTRGMPAYTPAVDAGYLKALGLTAQQMKQLAESSLTGAVARTPIQKSQTATAVKDLSMERAQYKAAPDPAAAAAAALNAMLMGINLAGMNTRYPQAGSAMSPQQRFQRDLNDAINAANRLRTQPATAAPSTPTAPAYPTGTTGTYPYEGEGTNMIWAPTMEWSFEDMDVPEPYSDAYSYPQGGEIPTGTYYEPYTDTSVYDPGFSYYDDEYYY